VKVLDQIIVEGGRGIGATFRHGNERGQGELALVNRGKRRNSRVGQYVAELLSRGTRR